MFCRIKYTLSQKSTVFLNNLRALRQQHMQINVNISLRSTEPTDLLSLKSSFNIPFPHWCMMFMLLQANLFIFISLLYVLIQGTAVSLRLQQVSSKVYSHFRGELDVMG